MRTHAAIAQQIDMYAKQVFDVLPECNEIEQAATRLHLDKQIDIAHLPGFAPCQRAEDANIARAMSRRTVQDLIATSAQAIQIDSCRFSTRS